MQMQAALPRLQIVHELILQLHLVAVVSLIHILRRAHDPHFNDLLQLRCLRTKSHAVSIHIMEHLVLLVPLVQIVYLAAVAQVRVLT